MRSNIDSGAPPPPSPAPSAPSATADEIHEMSLNALQMHLADLLHKGMPGRGSGDPAADGSPSVSSLVSVWLISQVAHAVGKPKLVNLAKVKNKQDLTSLRGAAKLVRGGLDALRPVRVAS